MDKNISPKSNFSKLKTNQVKEIISKIYEMYNFDAKLLLNYSFYQASKDKIYISSINIDEININRIQGLGIYFGTIHDNNRLRLSIEGSQLIRPEKNYIKINDKILKSYLAAENLFLDEIYEINWDNKCPFLIVKYENENLGCISIKDKLVLTYMPKSRKLDFNKVF
jgi:NOL1/NOP2/fmu family ribosome biogenesis protein